VRCVHDGAPPLMAGWADLDVPAAPARPDALLQGTYHRGTNDVHTIDPSLQEGPLTERPVPTGPQTRVL
jgi:hypothetical protein